MLRESDGGLCTKTDVRRQDFSAALCVPRRSLRLIIISTQRPPRCAESRREEQTKFVLFVQGHGGAFDLNESGPPICIYRRFVCGPLRATSAACSLLQLRLKIRQIEVLSVRLNFAVRVDLEDANAVDEENVSSLGLKT